MDIKMESSISSKDQVYHITVNIHGNNNTVSLDKPIVPSTADQSITPSNLLETFKITPLVNPGPRKSIQLLWKEYRRGNCKELEDLIDAFDRIQQLEPTNPNSFFAIAGLHGSPLRLRYGIENLKNDLEKYTYWGGYCHHGNVLFPVWHRAYLQVLENALQSEVPTAHMAYWDELDGKGVPEIFLLEKFRFSDGREIKNPLKSYTLPLPLNDFPDQTAYIKPKGYTTVRYPLSGLVGTEEAQELTEIHNSKFPPPKDGIALQENVKQWQNGPPPSNPPRGVDGIMAKFEKCLKAPNYTVFSNNTSANAYNLSRKMDEHQETIVPIESPHDDMHLAVGGFDFPGFQAGILPGANGDMGENNTASFDPIFHFHHCFIDHIFWQWQQRHDSTKYISIEKRYPGTTAFESQGPTPGYSPNDNFDEESPLYPFVSVHGQYWTANQMSNIENWGYSYHEYPKTITRRNNRVEAFASVPRSPENSEKFVIDSVSRRRVSGSSILVAYASPKSNPSEKFMIGYQSILSRVNVEGCANCLTHVNMSCVFQPYSIARSLMNDLQFEVKLITHHGVIEERVLKVEVY
jgi:tyrosinase